MSTDEWRLLAQFLDIAAKELRHLSHKHANSLANVTLVFRRSAEQAAEFRERIEARIDATAPGD